MLIRNKTPRTLGLDEPIRHEQAHKRPVTRRDFLAQGFTSGLATIAAPTVFSLFADPRAAQAALSPDLVGLTSRDFYGAYLEGSISDAGEKLRRAGR